MSIFIPIDRTSIRRNERAGQSVTFTPGMPTAEMTVAFVVRVGSGDQARLSDVLVCLAGEMGHHAAGQKASDGVRFIEFVADPTRDLTADFEALAGTIEQLGAQVVRDACRVVMKVPQSQVWHAPIPRFAFVYVPTEVACEDCGARCLHTALRSDSGDDWYSDRVCPQCGALDCCDLEFEHMTDAEMAAVCANKCEVVVPYVPVQATTKRIGAEQAVNKKEKP